MKQLIKWFCIVAGIIVLGASALALYRREIAQELIRQTLSRSGWRVEALNFGELSPTELSITSLSISKPETSISLSNLKILPVGILDLLNLSQAAIELQRIEITLKETGRDPTGEEGITSPNMIQSMSIGEIKIDEFLISQEGTPALHLQGSLNAALTAPSSYTFRSNVEIQQ
ncbi:MAG: hypothetical protein KDD42_06520, partial [Bdellovibrionales bacterium]|nr:hypothetical protein [Bdellovibrionales bacterium]